MKSNRTKATHRFQGDFIIRQYVAAGKRTLVFKKRTNKIEDLKRFKLAGYRKLLNRKNKVLILCGFCYDKGREVYLEITRDIKPYNLRTASEYTNYHFSDCPSYCPSNKPINLIKNIETMKSMFAKTSLHDWTKLFNDYSKNKNIPFVKKCLLFDEEEKKISLALLSTLFLSSYASDKEDSKLTKARKKFFFNLSMNSIEDFEKFLEEKKKDLENPYALFKFDIGKYINSANGKMTGFYDEKTESIKICKYNADEGRIYSPFWKKGMSYYRSIKIH